MGARTGALGYQEPGRYTHSRDIASGFSWISHCGIVIWPKSRLASSRCQIMDYMERQCLRDRDRGRRRCAIEPVGAGIDAGVRTVDVASASLAP